MKKFQPFLVALIALVSVFLINGGVYAAVVSGNITINPQTVSIGEVFNITVTASSHDKLSSLAVNIYSEGNSIASRTCTNANSCEIILPESKSVAGSYSYFGYITSEGKTSGEGTFQTNPITVTVSSASGAPAGSSCPAGQICNPLAYNDVESLINAIIDFLIKIGTPIAAIMFVVAGFVFVTSAGDPEKVKTARRIMIYTAVGLAVILIASGLIKVLQSLLQTQ